MERGSFTDETLMAYADGELDPDTARAVAHAAQSDQAIAKRIAMFSRTRDLLGEAARARPLEPLSPDLEARVAALLRDKGEENSNETVVPFRPRTPVAPGFRPLAAAAAFALAVGIVGGFVVSQAMGDREQGGLQFASLETPELADALDAISSGQRVDVKAGEFLAIASFTNADGEFCREFEYDRMELDTVVSVACRTEIGWQPRFAVVASGSDDTGYAPASSLETLDAYLMAIGAGAPMSPDEEAAALRALPN
jgi:anti-sigma factor RsiW